MARTRRREVVYGSDGRAVVTKTHRDGKTGYVVSRRADERAAKRSANCRLKYSLRREALNLHRERVS